MTGVVIIIAVATVSAIMTGVMLWLIVSDLKARNKNRDESHKEIQERAAQISSPCAVDVGELTALASEMKRVRSTIRR